MWLKDSSQSPHPSRGKRKFEREDRRNIKDRVGGGKAEKPHQQERKTGRKKSH
jgi:hypothetical protein